MKIKTIKRCVFLSLLILPLLMALCSYLAPYIHGTANVAIDNNAFANCLGANLPDFSSRGYFANALDDLYTYLTGVAPVGSVLVVLSYIAYGIDIYLLWICVDVFIGLPTVLHRFIDRRIYDEK